MRGSYRTLEDRPYIRTHFANDIVPGLQFAETSPLRSHLKRNSNLVAIDVGANKGFWAAAFLREFPGRVDHVYMIDPSPENFRELMNFVDNLMFTEQELMQVSAYPYAIGDAAGMATLYTNEDGSPLASLFEHKLHGCSHDALRIDLGKSISVPFDTIDSFMKRHGLSFVDVLKADTEGCEFTVFCGARDAFRDKAIGCAVFEFGMHQVESRHFFKDFYEFFTSFNYKMYQFIDGKSVPVPRYEYKYENFTGNFIFAAVDADRGTTLG
jgi:FkbM family methyltransferase